MSQYCSFKGVNVSTGDSLKISQEIIEGDKKRIQMFEGIVIAIKNAGAGKSITVRKLAANGIGVEKIFPLLSPSIKKVELKRVGQVHRSKLYYLRDRVGKAATRIKEEASNSKSAVAA